ncbi:unnamed protein product [Soboliphyme baturini]|uniref:TGFb_propeptide domain-containing protein n=1 Tax=Soboliphyme baturini TaxID=241478 RepID=A0A183IUR5_9BILA|nr:unnamed protein product [Soboliphyme baturini]
MSSSSSKKQQPLTPGMQAKSNAWINVLEHQFLRKLGLTARPRPQRPVRVPDKLKTLYGQLSSFDADSGHWTTKTSAPMWSSARTFEPEGTYALRVRFLVQHFLRVRPVVHCMHHCAQPSINYK